MNVVVIDAAMREKLQAADGPVELRDESGMLVAHAFVHSLPGTEPHIVGGEPPATRSVYERFTDRSRKVMQLANQEAQRVNHEYIGTEHILIGLAKEGAGVAANILKNLDIDLRRLRLEVEKILPTLPAGEPALIGRLPHTSAAKRAVEHSIDEARKFNNNYVGTEHLLLGLLCEEEGAAFQILTNLGLNRKSVRREVRAILGQPPA